MQGLGVSPTRLDIIFNQPQRPVIYRGLDASPIRQDQIPENNSKDSK